MNQMRFDDKVVLITGTAPGGLGHAYAKLLAARGATIVVNDLGVDWAGNQGTPGSDEVAREINDEGGVASSIHGDVVSDSQRIVDEVVQRHGRLDVLINNAGSGGDFEAMLRTHVVGSYNMTEAAWPWLEKAGTGRLVNTASNATWASDGPPGYGTAKSAVIAMTRIQARNGRASGIGVNVVLPSAWANSTAGIPDADLATFLRTRFGPEHVAGFVAYLAHESATVSGQAFSVGGGVVARVVQAKTRGHVDLGGDPDIWAAHIDEITDLSGELVVPPSMWGDVRMLAARIGDDAVAEFDELDFSMLGGL